MSTFVSKRCDQCGVVVGKEDSAGWYTLHLTAVAAGSLGSKAVPLLEGDYCTEVCMRKALHNERNAR